MPTILPASGICWLFCCASLGIAISYQSVRGEDTKTAPAQIAVESWIVELELLDKTGYTLGGKPLAEIFVPGKISRHAELGPKTSLRELLSDLKDKGLARVVSAPKLVLQDGERGSLKVDDVTVDATATAIQGQIRLEYKCDQRVRIAKAALPHAVSNRLVAALRIRTQPTEMGHQVIHVNFDEIKSGQPFAMTIGPLPQYSDKTLVLFIVATIDDQTISQAP